VYIRSLRVSNLRSFRTADLTFQYPGRAGGSQAAPNVNLLLGNNGAGKSSILRAIALATISPVISSSGFVPYRLVRQTPDDAPDAATIEAELLLHGQDVGAKSRRIAIEESASARIVKIRDVEQIVAPTIAEIGEHWDNIYDDRSPAFLIVGYGANRQVETPSAYDAGLRRKSRNVRYERVAGLFEEHVTLTPLGAWLPQYRRTNPGRYRQVANLINRLLPDECRFPEETASPDLPFALHGVPVPFGALSDGYRAYIGWIADLLYHICMGAPSGAKLVENRGIVLIDEIDLHLHPEWQRTVIPRLAEMLPNLQFVVTSHSPIVAGTLESSNIYVMESDETGATTAQQFNERIHGLSAEQILLSSYFNLPTTRAPAMEDELAAIARRARDGDASAALEYVRRLAAGTDDAADG
jgi:hypothetical protein